MEEKKKKKNPWGIVLLILFIVFISLYFMNVIGYYDVNRNKMLLTEEKIEEFESDIASGKYIDINDYFKEEKREYDNSFSNISLNVSNGIDTILNKGLKNTMKALGKLFK